MQRMLNNDLLHEREEKNGNTNSNIEYFIIQIMFDLHSMMDRFDFICFFL